MSADVLGFSFRDRITGFTGVAIGHCVYLASTPQTLLVPRKCKADGTRAEEVWIDHQRLERLMDDTNTAPDDAALAQGEQA